jgi:predicted transcriptional regulator
MKIQRLKGESMSQTDCFVALKAIGHPATAEEIAEVAKNGVSNTRRFMRNLVEKGCVARHGEGYPYRYEIVKVVQVTL